MWNHCYNSTYHEGQMDPKDLEQEITDYDFESVSWEVQQDWSSDDEDGQAPRGGNPKRARKTPPASKTPPPSSSTGIVPTARGLGVLQTLDASSEGTDMASYLPVQGSDSQMVRVRKSELKGLHDSIVRAKEACTAAESICLKAATCFAQEKLHLESMARSFGEHISSKR